MKNNAKLAADTILQYRPCISSKFRYTLHLLSRMPRWISRRSAALLAPFGVLTLLAGPAIGQNPTVSAPVPDLSGLWELKEGSRHVGRASLTERAIAEDKQAAAERAAGHVITRASRWCGNLGVPFIMGQSPPIDIVQTNDEIGIFSEQHSDARHIYLDGRPHPALPLLEATTNGHSIGHWEGDTLVVDTIGFNDYGNGNIPGGGNRTPTSHLVERFRLLDQGKQLSVTFTWDDPREFLKPHTYDFLFYKMPDDAYVYEDFCDPSDPTQWENHSTKDPVQK